MPIPSLMVASLPSRWRGVRRLSSISSELMICGSTWRPRRGDGGSPLSENTYRMAIVGGLTPALGFSAHLPENRGGVAHCRAALSIEQWFADHRGDRVRLILFCVAGCPKGTAWSSDAGAFERRPRRRQNFSGNGAALEKVPASMASRAMSNAVDALVASTPVTNCQIFLRPVMRGLPLDRKILARHLPGPCSKASTKNPRYSMRPARISTVSGYDTGVSEGLRQTGENEVLSWALVSWRRSRPAKWPTSNFAYNNSPDEYHGSQHGRCRSGNDRGRCRLSDRFGNVCRCRRPRRGSGARHV